MIRSIMATAAIAVEAWIVAIAYLHDTAAKKAGAALALAAVFAALDLFVIAVLAIRKWLRGRSTKPAGAYSRTTPTRTRR